jgi:hypothetical protein
MLCRLPKSIFTRVLPVSVDSPMATAATRIYARRKEDHDLEMQQLNEARQNPLSTRRFSLVHTPDSLKALDVQAGPAIIISASGMATGGRILHHLARFLPDPQASSCWQVIKWRVHAAGGSRKGRRKSKFTATGSRSEPGLKISAVYQRMPTRPNFYDGSPGSSARLAQLSSFTASRRLPQSCRSRLTKD